jgi:hypothetical protein
VSGDAFKELMEVDRAKVCRLCQLFQSAFLRIIFL